MLLAKSGKCRGSGDGVPGRSTVSGPSVKNRWVHYTTRQNVVKHRLTLFGADSSGVLSTINCVDLVEIVRRRVSLLGT